MPKILHFADAHIDMANYGRHDPETGLPLRVMDFLKSLDTIVDAAIAEPVDLVLFAGDAYKDRNPAPTFQREWGRRIMRLSKAGIPTLLLVGNHDLSPALGRAHAIEEFSTLEVPGVTVVDKPAFLKPGDLGGVPVQIAALPWISRSGLLVHLGLSAADPAKIYEELETRLGDLVNAWLDEDADPRLPVILTAHCSVQGALYGTERVVMLGNDLVLSGSFVRNPRFDYVALGHIHKPQDLNPENHPPVIYPGSIERVDFGEAADKKYYVIVDVKKGQTRVEWRELTGVRPFRDVFVKLASQEGVTERLLGALPPVEEMADAILRMTVEYPHDWDALIDEATIREACKGCFEFHFNKRSVNETRVRIPGDKQVSTLPPSELLELYFRARNISMDEAESRELCELAEAIFAGREENEA